MEEGADICHQAKARVAEGMMNSRQLGYDSRGGFRRQISRRQGGSPSLFPVSPLKHLSLSPSTCQGGAEGPVPGPGQAVPCVPGRGWPGGHLPAGPAEELHGAEDVCQQLGRGEEEGPVLPDQAADGEWGPCPRGVMASLPASRVAYPPTSSLSSPASLKGLATPTFHQGRD